VREQEQKKKRAAKHATGTTTGGAPNKTAKKREHDKRQEAVDMIIETIEALIASAARKTTSGARWSSRH